jgi:hypothetical protein
VSIPQARRKTESDAPEVLDDVLASGVQAVVEQCERLEDVTPVLALVVLS